MNDVIPSSSFSKPLLEIKLKDDWCYVDANVSIFEPFVTSLVKQDMIYDIPAPHVTLFSGFDPAEAENVLVMARGFQLTVDDILPKACPEMIRTADGKPLWVVFTQPSDKLQACFSSLVSTFKNTFKLHDGVYTPHVTLCWLKT